MAATDCALRAVLRPGDHVVIPDDAYGGHLPVDRQGVHPVGDPLHRRWRWPIWTRSRRRSPTETQADLGGDAHQPAAARSPTSPRSPNCPQAPSAKLLGGQHLCLTGAAAAADPRAPTSCCIPRPSTSADTPMSVGGALLTSDEELDTAFAFLQNGAGAVPGPFDAYLTMRGASRPWCCACSGTARTRAKVAEFLAEHPADRHGALSGSAQPSRPRGGGQADDRFRRHGVGAAARRARGGPGSCARAPRFSFSPNRWAGWSR